MENASLSDSKLIENIEQDALPENELFKILKNLQNESFNKFSKNDFKSAIIYLKKSEELLEAMMTQGGEIKHDEILVTLHNLGFCYQKLIDLNKSAAYIEACIYNASNFNVFSNDCTEAHCKIKKTSYLAKIHIQSCAVLSQIQNHKQALNHARRSLHSSLSMMNLTIKAAEVYSSTFFKLKKLRKSIPTASMHIHSILGLVGPSLKAISAFLKHGTLSKGGQIPSVLGVKEYPDWLLNMSLSDLMLMQPLSIEDLTDSTGIQSEFTKDFLIMKVCILAVSYFCVSTELQFLNISYEDAKKYHEKSLQLLLGFIPEQSPLFQHVNDSYIKRFKILINEIVINK